MIETVIVLWLVAVAIFMWSRRQPLEAPPGYKIVRDRILRWDYYHHEDKVLRSTGYLTRRAAIRAATKEYERRLRIND